MGSGDKFSVSVTKGFGFAVFVDRWPHQLSLTIMVACVMIYIGIGKGYDEVE